MKNRKPASKLSNKPHVAGIIDSTDSFNAALRLHATDLDFFEIRVDAFAGREEDILAKLPKLKLPLIITVRHSLEGGLHSLSTQKRRICFEKFMPYAALIDVELRSARSLKGIIARAREKNVSVILSYHNFQTTPSAARLDSLVKAAHKAGADIFKIATVVSTPADIAALLSLAHARQKLPLSLMGMGPFGKVSRLVFAQAGSVLNYGFLHKAQVSGQWPAVLLKKRIEELPAA
jgi:3-dehydroquinate dehydratase-1